jgi:restriction system protein
MWQIQISHPGLNKYRVIRGTDRLIVEQKAQAQQFQWDAMWQRQQLRESQQKNREQTRHALEEQLQEARERTELAESELNELREILAKTLTKNDAVDWETLKDHREFPEAVPQPPIAPTLPVEPYELQAKYRADFSVIDRLFATRRAKILAGLEQLYRQDHKQWQEEVQRLNDSHKLAEVEYRASLTGWEEKRAAFLAEQAKANESVEERKSQYEKRDPGAIADYCEMVLSNSEYPDSFPRGFDVEYRTDSQSIIVDYELPTIEQLPCIKEVKFVRSRSEFTELPLKDSELRKLYDDVIYQITLRTVHELLEADVISAIVSVVFNGLVNSVDKATGRKTRKCILSLQSSRDQFTAIDLSQIDFRACFRSLKGVASSALHTLTPIAPIDTISREDARFIDSYSVVGELDDRTNLAAMDWEDFEHLIREVFEKEFAASGGEVKVTQASRDGGVDAVAFDPDPIRGGKIVIQAKRYTRTVGVSAVRDLYGTLLNEGATKGILVTTADYGPDAYEFAKGKPLTLLNGGNLLHLLEKHGHRARINLDEARRLA